jgi:hypothetical protein
VRRTAAACNDGRAGNDGMRASGAVCGHEMFGSSAVCGHEMFGSRYGRKVPVQGIGSPKSMTAQFKGVTEPS